MPATLYALTAILLWSSLALFANRLNHIPSLLLTGLGLIVGGLIGLPFIRQWKVPWRTFWVGSAGIFGYHFFYFSAFRFSPAVETNLVNYLWPLLIVMLTPLYFRHISLRPQHILGSLMGLVGAAVIMTGGGVKVESAHLPGYLLAAGAALIWSNYSLATKKLPLFPSIAVSGFCLLSGTAAVAVFLLTQGGVQPLLDIPLSSLGTIFLLGLGPLGLAFIAWDAAMKSGDPRTIGALSYLTPLLSTLVLSVFGVGKLTLAAGLALVLIVGGALLAGSTTKDPSAG